MSTVILFEEIQMPEPTVSVIVKLPGWLNWFEKFTELLTSTLSIYHALETGEPVLVFMKLMV